MVQEQQQLRCTSSVRYSKKSKAKKIPQRGLGVAQLEKLRLEELEKNLASSSSSYSTATHLSPRRHQQSLEPGNSTVDSARGDGHGFLPMLWSAMEQSPGFGFHPPLANEQPGSFSHQRHQQPQHPSPLVSKVLPHSSSGVGLQMEPPSNQNYSRDYHPPSLQEQRDTIGMKRPWPFHLDSMSAPVPCKIPPFSSLVKTNGLLLSANDLIRCENKATAFSTRHAERTASDIVFSKIKKEMDSSSDGGFLTLATPSASFAKQSRAMPASQVQDYYESSLASSPVSNTMPVGTYDDGNSSAPFNSFLPVAPASWDRNLNEWKSKVSDDIDLDLKL